MKLNARDFSFHRHLFFAAVNDYMNEGENDFFVRTSENQNAAKSNRLNQIYSGT